MSSRRLIALFAVLFAAGLQLSAPGVADGAGRSPVSVQDEGLRIVVAEGEGQQYWPNWRGPSGQGLVEDAGYPDSWSDTENVLWKVSVPGIGHSSPIVWKEQIFLTTSYENGTEMSVLSYDRGDGEQHDRG